MNMMKDQKLVHVTGEIIENTGNNSIVNFSYLSYRKNIINNL